MSIIMHFFVIVILFIYIYCYKDEMQYNVCIWFVRLLVDKDDLYVLARREQCEVAFEDFQVGGMRLKS